ncbi:MFS transporter [Bradyrhizobium sp. Ai1a-2]|uniref:MFS transporter n=1 Tax=Bradyrhizobium sp. Ai1a-2 TaxID=196490 RepID=UPI001362621E|nr:MFS transporter [Bradyrhizobium sp. Ai1a-2]
MDQVNSGAFQTSLIKTGTLCFSAILFDGIDTASIGITGPAIALSLGVPVASMTMPFVMTSIGAVVGYLAAGYLVSRWNARRTLVASVLAFGSLTILTPHAGSIAMLAVLRFVTAIALGAALPCAVSIVVSESPRTLRQVATILVGTGLAAGGLVGGVLGGLLTKNHGWQSLFYVGGVAPLILVPCLMRWLPPARESDPAGSSQAYFELIRCLLSPPFKRGTLCLWIFSFLIFADVYALIFWLPPLLMGFGYSFEQSQFGGAFFSSGGLIANLLVIALASRFTISRIVLLASLLATLCLLGIALHAAIPSVIWFAIAGAGAGLITCSVAQSALAVALYPESSRTSGVGLSAAAGRIGSIVGPAAAGLLFSLQWSPQSIALAAIVPALLASTVLPVLANSASSRGIGD